MEYNNRWLIDGWNNNRWFVYNGRSKIKVGMGEGMIRIVKEKKIPKDQSKHTLN